MAPVGQLRTHSRHPTHLSMSTMGRLFSMVMAPNLQLFSHLPQPMQPFVQASRTARPFSTARQRRMERWP